jgi:hypothetical protein
LNPPQADVPLIKPIACARFNGRRSVPEHQPAPHEKGPVTNVVTGPFALGKTALNNPAPASQVASVPSSS